MAYISNKLEGWTDLGEITKSDYRMAALSMRIAELECQVGDLQEQLESIETTTQQRER